MESEKDKYFGISSYCYSAFRPSLPHTTTVKDYMKINSEKEILNNPEMSSSLNTDMATCTFHTQKGCDATKANYILSSPNNEDGVETLFLVKMCS